MQLQQIYVCVLLGSFEQGCLLRMTFCFACFPFYSWQAQAFFLSTSTIKQCKESGIQSKQRYKGWIAPLKSAKEKLICSKSLLTQWASGHIWH